MKARSLNFSCNLALPQCGNDGPPIWLLSSELRGGCMSNQRPLSGRPKHRGVPWWVFAVLVAVVVAWFILRLP